MLFRLANYLKFRHVLFIGAASTPVVEYLSTLSKGMIFWNAGPLSSLGNAHFVSDPTEVAVAPLELIYLGRNLQRVWSPKWEVFLKTKREEPICILITDIYKKQLNTQLWRQLRQEATVSIDMMWYGLLFFNHHLQKGKYNLII